jgi:endonuclease/exonuclease/phosphatase family metal-dependent hydrolase
MPQSRVVSGRLPAGTEVRVLAERLGGRWLQIQGPSGQTGWITSRYLDWRPQPPSTTPDRGSPPPRTGEEGFSCPIPPPSPPPRLRPEAAPVTWAGPGSPEPAPRQIAVASYNVWELYDGLGKDRYLSRHHADSLTPTDAKLRVGKLAAQLRSSKPHVIAFQEIENAELACQVASLAVPGGRWACVAGRWSKGENPQNVALASRIGGTLRVLHPDGRFAPRGAVELTALGGKLRIISVHLKSSRGARGSRDCPNSHRREAMARALVSHLEPSRAQAAALVAGDFNFDPERSSHDLADDRLRDAGLACLRSRFYPRGAPSTYPGFKSTIDLAFFRPAAGIVAAGFKVLTDASTDKWVSDHKPVVATLERP